MLMLRSASANKAACGLVVIGAGILYLYLFYLPLPSSPPRPTVPSAAYLRVAAPTKDHDETELGADQVVVLRACGNITDKVREAVVAYATGLRNRYDVWLLYDTGHAAREPDAHRLAAVQALQIEMPWLGIFYFNEAAVLAFLPSAEFLAQKGQINWWFHDASVMLWASLCYPSSFPSPPSPWTRPPSTKPGGVAIERDMRVWVVEVDALFTGQLGDFVAHHDNNTADFLSFGIELVPRGRWPFESWSSWEVPQGRMLRKQENVERFSFRLLRFLLALVELNVVSWGESFAPTVCSLASRWCVVEQLDDRFKGSTYIWKGRISDQQVEQLMRDPLQRDKWFHAVTSRKSVGCDRSQRV